MGRAEALGLLRGIGAAGAAAPHPVIGPPTRPMPDKDRPTRSGDPVPGQAVGPPGFGGQPADVHQPGGSVLFDLQHPEFRLVEEMYRILPDESWFQPTVSASNPIQFEIGAFTVPNGQQYWLFDYEFSVYRFSGIDPGDYIKAEAGRFTGVMGWDITVNGRRPSHLLYELDPHAAQVQKQSFSTPGPLGQAANASSFNRSAAQSFAAVASQGTSVLPVRRAVQGAQGAPFTLIARQQDKVALSIIIFRRIRAPIAAIEARHAGFLLQGNTADALIARMRPR
jgi:hypothetical protein